MSDLIRDLYMGRVYPPMSHPLADPAVTAVAARMAGLGVPHPRRARILEIGCSSGHHLIPLALRWPESRFTGIDLAASAIHDARERAAAAGADNVEFLAADLREYEPPGGPFDFIIAHGFFSWVADEVKAALLAFCQRHLSPAGIATISFNLESGWKNRFPLIAKVRAIQQAMGGDEISVLEVLRRITPPSAPEVAVIDDMLAKGAGILPFDDFAPVNDAWRLDRFAQAAAAAGLRWLGESDPTENLPSCLDARQLVEIKRRAPEPLAFQLALDEAAGRTFRSGVLCRDDAPVAGGSRRLDPLMDFSVLPGRREPEDNPAAREIFDAIRARAPSCVPVRDLASGIDPRLISTMITRGWLQRSEEVV
jgi:SAM-dependent methyltransferase